MKYFFLSILSILVVSCNTAQTAKVSKKTRVDYANSITADELKTMLYTFASDEMQGRMTGEKGQKLAAEYLRNFYQDNGIASPIEKNNYYQTIPAEYFSRMSKPKSSENVVAFIEGSEKPDEIIVLSAHYDHVGMKEDGTIYNGADDDGSGTVALLEIAEAFQQAVKDGNGPKRSILFLHVTAEEIGLYGSRYYTENPLFPLENTVANLNTDMIGRIDPDKKDNPEYIYFVTALLNIIPLVCLFYLPKETWIEKQNKSMGQPGKICQKPVGDHRSGYCHHLVCIRLLQK